MAYTLDLIDVSEPSNSTPELAKLCYASPHTWESRAVSPEFFKSLGTRAKRLLEIGMIHDYLESLEFIFNITSISNRCSILKDETWIIISFNHDEIVVAEQVKGDTIRATYYDYDIDGYTKFFNTINKLVKK